jgi:hypothetical protein
MFMLGKALACVEGEPSPESVREAVSLLERHIHLGGRHTAEAADLLNVLREKIKHI